MSGIAGIIQFDGASVERLAVEKMTGALAHRGPHGIRHWVKGAVGLGQCMLRTTPESLEEIQPLTNEDETLVLVMDGRVDNREDLGRELMRRGSVLRDRSDAELVLRAYEVWGEECPNQIIGEAVFFIWDARQRRLFGARDAAGTRHFYYHKGNGWFAFASEIKGLLALGRIDPKLNETRLLEYLVSEFDRDDEVGTFYKDINRLPAGHAMRATAQDTKTWRYWNPANLQAISFDSLEECAEAFLEQLRVAVKCRLRSIGPVGSMLSGGLDSSSIVGLISKEFRHDLTHPLRTFSLIQHDRENCADWLSIRHMLKDDWIEPTIITSDLSIDACQEYFQTIPGVDEPFRVTHGGLTGGLIFGAARASGCHVVMDGAAGDLLFYGFGRTRDAIFRRKLYKQIPATIVAARRHGGAVANEIGRLTRAWLACVAPEGARATFRKFRDERAALGEGLSLLQSEIAANLRSSKYKAKYEAETQWKRGNDQSHHARDFTSGLLSFAHEVSGEIAFSQHVEPRSPFSDRRMIEFAIRMPLEAKLAVPWYKFLLRKSMEGILPEEVRWRRSIGRHPGWKFQERIVEVHERIMSNMVDVPYPPENNPSNLKRLAKWIDIERVVEKRPSFETKFSLFRLKILSYWLKESRFGDS